jgi:thiol-disulfide isomerase/thioredoxin
MDGRRLSRLLLFLFLLLGLVASVTLAIGPTTATAAEPETDPETAVETAAIRSGGLVGLRAPTCELAPLVEGDVPAKTIAFGRAVPGRVTLVDFWASWCPTCERAFGFLDGLARELGDAGLSVVAVNLDADPRDAMDFLAGRVVGQPAGRPAAFEVVRDPTGNCPRGFGLVGMPSAYLIDASGQVRAVTRGFRPGEALALRREIEALLAPAHDALPAVAAGPPVSEAVTPAPSAR